MLMLVPEHGILMECIIDESESVIRIRAACLSGTIYSLINHILAALCGHPCPVSLGHCWDKQVGNTIIQCPIRTAAAFMSQNWAAGHPSSFTLYPGAEKASERLEGIKIKWCCWLNQILGKSSSLLQRALFGFTFRHLQALLSLHRIYKFEICHLCADPNTEPDLYL
jgi:hypothetical protein